MSSGRDRPSPAAAGDAGDESAASLEPFSIVVVGLGDVTNLPAGQSRARRSRRHSSGRSDVTPRRPGRHTRAADGVTAAKPGLSRFWRPECHGFGGGPRHISSPGEVTAPSSFSLLYWTQNPGFERHHQSS